MRSCGDSVGSYSRTDLALMMKGILSPGFVPVSLQTRLGMCDLLVFVVFRYPTALILSISRNLSGIFSNFYRL